MVIDLRAKKISTLTTTSGRDYNTIFTLENRKIISHSRSRYTHIVTNPNNTTNVTYSKPTFHHFETLGK